MTSDEQLAEWVKGNSLCPNDKGECCADFSCCVPELLADIKTREVFAAATDEKRKSMLGMFLGAAIGSMGKSNKVYLAGVDAPDASVN